MQDNITKKQHYVPQVYIKNWCSQKNELLYLYLKRGIINTTSPKSICNEDYLYEINGKDGPNLNYFETQYSKFETEIGKTLKKLISKLDNTTNSGLIFNADEKKFLKKLFITMLIRNPHYMNNCKRIVQLIIQDTNLAKRMNLDNGQNFEKYILLIFLDYMYDKAYIRKRCDLREDNISGYLYRGVEDYIDSLDIYILKSKECFIFSNNPAYVDIKQNFCFLPLNPSYCIAYMDKKIKKEKISLYEFFILNGDLFKPNRIINMYPKEVEILYKYYLNYPCDYLYAVDTTLGRKILKTVKHYWIETCK